jgi:hypothetical protein
VYVEPKVRKLFEEIPPVIPVDERVVAMILDGKKRNVMLPIGLDSHNGVFCVGVKGNLQNQTSSRLQHPEHLEEGLPVQPHMLKDITRDNDVKRSIRKLEFLQVGELLKVKTLLKDILGEVRIEIIEMGVKELRMAAMTVGLKDTFLFVV